jgi:hypothetical protein
MAPAVAVAVVNAEVDAEEHAGGAQAEPRRYLFFVGGEPVAIQPRSYAERIAHALYAEGHEVVIARRRRGALPLPVDDHDAEGAHAADRAHDAGSASSGSSSRERTSPRLVDFDPGPLPRALTPTHEALAEAGPLHRRLSRWYEAHRPFDAIVGEGPFGALVAEPLAARAGLPFVLALASCEVERRGNQLTRDQLYLAELEHWACDRAGLILVPGERTRAAVERM